MSKQHSQDSPPLKARAIAQRLQLLYSWREHLATQSGRARRADAAARKAAENEIDRVRQQVRRELDRLAAELQHTYAASQQRPGNLVIEEKLDQLRHEIRQLNAVLKAQRSDDLGGPVELPLDHYPVELGLGRSATAFRLEREDFITLAAAATIIVVSCLAITWYYVWRADVTFELVRPDDEQVVIHFRNDSSFTARFYGPWPANDSGLEDHSYGIRLHCRPTGSDTFQDCTSIRDVWSYQGKTIAPLDPIQVETGIQVSVVLHVPQLVAAYGEALDAIRIEGGSRRNRDARRFTVELQE